MRETKGRKTWKEDNTVHVNAVVPDSRKICIVKEHVGSWNTLKGTEESEQERATLIKQYLQGIESHAKKKRHRCISEELGL